MVRTDHDEPDEDPADYESEGRVFESPWAHPPNTSDSLTRAPSVPLRQLAFSVLVTTLVTKTRERVS